MYLERCKGFEQDAKKFLYTTANSKFLQMNYDLVRPLVQRTVQLKKKQEVLQLFEQIRKNLKLNASWEGVAEDERKKALKDLKGEFYTQFIDDLMAMDKYELAEMIMAEKVKDRYPMLEHDELVMVNIYGMQKDFDNYKEKFNLFMDDDSQFDFTDEISQHLSKTLQNFNEDNQKAEQLTMVQKIIKKMHNL